MNPNIRQKIAADPTTSVWVSASAGTGKTKVLTDRVLRLLLEGAIPQKILCLTFTKAAAKEMSLRINETLSLWSFIPEEQLIKQLQTLMDERISEKILLRARTLFSTILDLLAGLNIQTIHGFCQSILQRFPLEANLKPNFSIIDEKKTSLLQNKVIEEVLMQNMINSKDNQNLRAILHIIVEHIPTTTNFKDNIANILKFPELLHQITRNHSSNQDLKTAIYNFLEANLNKTSLELRLVACSNQSFNYANFLKIAELLKTKEIQQKCLDAQLIFTWLNLSPLERQKTTNFSKWQAIFFTDNFSIRKNFFTNSTLKLLDDAEITLLNTTFNQEITRLKALDLAYKNQVSAELNYAFMYMAKLIYQKYNLEKSKFAYLDFNDLIIKTYNLFTKSSDIMPWVLYKLDGGIEHILVDEAQDTNPLQWEIIKVLALEFFSGMSSNDTNRTIFIVGDIKQSIYRFQGANPLIFNEIKNFFEEKITQAQKQWKEVHLNVSFRSSNAILKQVNALTAGLFSPTLPNNKIYASEDLVHHPFFEDKPGHIEIWPEVLDISNKKASRYLNLSIAIANKIEELLQDKTKNFKSGDIMLLYKKRENNKIINLVVKQLKEKNIDVSGVDKLTINEHIAVMDLLALAKFLLQTKDDLNLACVLKGPLFNFTEEELFELSYKRNSSLFQNLQRHSHNNSNYQTALFYLTKWLNLVDFNPPFTLFAEILYVDQGLKKLIACLGHEAMDPISEFMNLALNFEPYSSYSLESFIDSINKSKTTVKRDIDQSQNMVKLLTVHAAKGLESRVVFLIADNNQGFSKKSLLKVEGKSPMLFLIPTKQYFSPILKNLAEEEKLADEEESKRLLYVALSRAKEYFFFCSSAKNQNIPEKSWLALLKNNLNNDFKKASNPSFFKKELGFIEETYYYITYPSPQENIALETTLHNIEKINTIQNNPQKVYPSLDNPITIKEHNFTKQPSLFSNLSNQGSTDLTNTIKSNTISNHITAKSALDISSTASTEREASIEANNTEIQARDKIRNIERKSVLESTIGSELGSSFRSSTRRNVVENVETNIVSGNKAIKDEITLNIRSSKTGNDVSPSKDSTFEIPNWFREIPLRELEHLPLLPSQLLQFPNTTSSVLNLESALLINKGIIAHKLLEVLPKLPVENWNSYIDNLLENYTNLIDMNNLSELKSNILRVISTPNLALLFTKESFSEVSVSGIIDNNTVIARIDRLIFLNEEILIIDYKYQETPQIIQAHYLAQIRIYKQLIQQLYPKKTIKTAILFIKSCTLVDII